MMVHKCDLCGKELTSDDRVLAGTDFFAKHLFCRKCGEPIMRFLEKKGLLKK